MGFTCRSIVPPETPCEMLIAACGRVFEADNNPPSAVSELADTAARAGAVSAALSGFCGCGVVRLAGAIAAVFGFEADSGANLRTIPSSVGPAFSVLLAITTPDSRLGLVFRACTASERFGFNTIEGEASAAGDAAGPVTGCRGAVDKWEPSGFPLKTSQPRRASTAVAARMSLRFDQLCRVASASFSLTPWAADFAESRWAAITNSANSSSNSTCVSWKALRSEEHTSEL